VEKADRREGTQQAVERVRLRVDLCGQLVARTSAGRDAVGEAELCGDVDRLRGLVAVHEPHQRRLGLGHGHRATLSASAREVKPCPGRARKCR
jgi:hypothetical protein